jgi:hypothetical protein
MALWKLLPVADPQDARWQDHGIYTVVVRAATPALARLVAEEVERAREGGEAPEGNSSANFTSAFGDEKLYHCHPLPAEAAAAYEAQGPEAVLNVTVHREPQRPVP